MPGLVELIMAVGDELGDGVILGDARGRVRYLNAAGIEVVGPVWDRRTALAENPAFFHAAAHASPWVAVKLAQTLDGIVDQVLNHNEEALSVLRAVAMQGLVSVPPVSRSRQPAYQAAPHPVPWQPSTTFCVSLGSG